VLSSFDAARAQAFEARSTTELLTPRPRGLIVLAEFALDHDRTGVFADERPVEIPPIVLSNRTCSGCTPNMAVFRGLTACIVGILQTR
jgi:hypothetical protein